MEILMNNTDSNLSMTGRKHRILLVVRWPIGGIRTFMRYVYRNFDPLKWQFTILAPDLPEMQILINDLCGQDLIYIPVGRNPRPTAFFCRVAKEILRGRYDLIHSHGFTAGMCSSLPAFLRNIPHLMTSHDIFNESQFAGFKGRAKKTIMGGLLSLINNIHLVSHDALDNFMEYFPNLNKNKNRFVVIQNGIEIERFKSAKTRNLRTELGLGRDTFLIGFLGRFMAQKGFRYLVQAIEIISNGEKLPGTPLVLAFGEGGFVREEKASIKEKGLEKYFHFMPFTSDVAGTLKGLDVVVMPSLWEACALLPMETLACGVPIIGTNCIGLREILYNTPARIVELGNGKALALAIEEEMSKNSKREFISFSNIAISRFNANNTSIKLRMLYNNILLPN